MRGSAWSIAPTKTSPAVFRVSCARLSITPCGMRLANSPVLSAQATGSARLVEFVFDSEPDHLRSGPQTELFKNPCPVRTDGLHTETQIVGDLRRCLARRDQSQNLEFAI